MANELARNIQDASLNPATFALPTTVASVTSSVIDLGADTFKPGNIEVELSVPALSSVIAPATSTAGAIFIVETSTTSTFAATARQIYSKTSVGSSSGIAATTHRCRVPSDCERYIRGKITFGTTMADGSAVAGTLTLRF